MHSNSMYLMEQFRNKYLSPDKELKILDIGSLQLSNHQCYKTLFNHSIWSYTGLDLVEGENVDIVSKNLYDYQIESNSYDVIISGQCIEHVVDIYAWIKELSRILAYNGIICIVGPYMFEIHKYPVDCWRVLPDGLKFLFEKVAGLKVLECDIQGDVIGIARKLKNENNFWYFN